MRQDEACAPVRPSKSLSLPGSEAWSCRAQDSMKTIFFKPDATINDVNITPRNDAIITYPGGKEGAECQWVRGEGGVKAASSSRIFTFFAYSNIKFRFSQVYFVSHGAHYF